MPTLTVKAINALKPRERAYKIVIDKGLQLRVAPDGIKTFLVRYTVKGCEKERQYTLPKTYGEGTGQLMLASACAEAHRIRALARDGLDWPAMEDEKRRAQILAAQEKVAQPNTFGEGLREYVEKKRRAKDGLSLKARTQSDYLAMIATGKILRNGSKTADGELTALAKKVMSDLTASDIRGVYDEVLVRSKRRAIYAMQVVRAVMRWHGIHMPNNPLGRETAGRDRIVIVGSVGNPQPIPNEKLGAWWLVASSMKSMTADYYRFLLLTGCRRVELLGSKKYGYAALCVGDVDVHAGRILLRDTKNRSDHTVLLSRQALSIARKYCEGRTPTEPLFVALDGRKTLARINAGAGTKLSGKSLRATFASIAEELVSGGVLKRMMNHAVNNDVTLGHYVGKSEAQLRAGWQAVADFIEGAAKVEGTDPDV
jgi:integrase